MKTFDKTTLTLTGLFIAGSMFAQDPVSFRKQGTGYLMDDDLDLMIDPLELGHMDGLRLYTNLSNLGTGQEQALGSQSDNGLVIGAGGQFPGFPDLRLAFLLNQQRDEHANPVGIDQDGDGFQDLFGDGELQSNYMRYYDMSNDGLFDYHVGRINCEKNIGEYTKRNILLSGGYEYMKTLFGLRMSIGSQKNSATELSSLTYERSDLNEGILTNDGMMSNQVDGLDENKEFALDLGASRTLTGGEIGVVLGLRNQSWTMEDLVIDNSAINEYDLDENLVYHQRSLAQYVEREEQEVSGVLARLSYRRTLKEAVERRQESFWDVQLQMGRQTGSHSVLNNTRSDWSVENGDLLEHTGSTGRTNEDGDLVLSRVGLAARWINSLDDRVRVAVGFSLTSSLESHELGGATTYSGADTNQVQDGVLDEHDQWVLTTSGQRYGHTMETKISSLILPVGVEYCFSKNKKWTLRLSALYSSQREENNDLIQVKNSDAVTTEHIGGDGSYSVDVSDNEYASQATSTVVLSDQTEFAYGLSFVPTANLQVDFMSIFGTQDNSILDTSFYRSLKLSVCIRM